MKRVAMASIVWGFMGPASAAEPGPSLVVGEVMVDRSDQLTPRFAVNPRLGRAWATLDVEDDDPEYGRVHTARFRVPGLSYDAEREVVVFELDGRRVDCGGLGSGLVTRDGCRVVVTTEQREIDDGFEVLTRTFAIVRVEAPAAGPTDRTAPTARP